MGQCCRNYFLQHTIITSHLHEKLKLYLNRLKYWNRPIIEIDALLVPTHYHKSENHHYTQHYLVNKIWNRCQTLTHQW